MNQEKRNQIIKIKKQASLNLLWEQAKEESKEHLAVIEKAIASLVSNKLDEEMRSQVEQVTHKLAGSLGMFGSEQGSCLARKIELLFEGKVPLKPEQAQHIEHLFLALQQEIKAVYALSLSELLLIMVRESQ